MIVDRINKYLTERKPAADSLRWQVRSELEKMVGFNFDRQFAAFEDYDNQGKLRMSSAGKCPRQLAYGFHGFEKAGKEQDSRSAQVFFDGDMLEAKTVALAKLAGCIIVATGFQQVNLKGKIKDIEVTGHPDGMVYDEENQEWCLIEIKSMSDYSFERFEKDGTIDSSYTVQYNMYLKKLGLKRVCYVAYDKNAGVYCERVFHFDDDVLRKGLQNLVTVASSTKENLPPAPAEYDPDPKTKLYPWQCLYCSYWKHCRPNGTLVLVRGANKLKEGS